MTLRRQVAEAVFASAVVLVEGHSDVGLLQGLADRHGGLDAKGVSIVNGHGKRQMLIPWAILDELGVPTYVVFDGDAGLSERMLVNGKKRGDAEDAQRAARRDNALVLRTIGAEGNEEPPTQVQAGYAVFADTVEAELAAWDGFRDSVEHFKQEQGDFRDKPGDAYRYAAAKTESEPPAVFASLLSRLKALAG
jgi:predicted ATP-dependent endonuclease of OLD family